MSWPMRNTMRLIRSFFSNIPKYLLWLVLSTILWMWIFTLVTDTRPEKKVTLLADVPALADPELAAALEQDLPDGIRMVKAHSTSFYLFGMAGMTGMDEADLYVIPVNDADQYLDSYLEFPEELIPEGAALYEKDGVVYGVRVYDAMRDHGAAMEYIEYLESEEARLKKDPSIPDRPDQDYYLFFSNLSIHCGQQDEAAFTVAENFMALP